jgi:pyruvate/2-oxoglutarate dehydrogenase complex dihydrolipoamide acyltransferase (E2) component
MLPKATITMTEASVVAWRKQSGEAVTKEEILLEMETDKVIVEVPAPASGFLLRIDVAVGVATLDQPVGWIGAPGESIPASFQSGPAESKTPTANRMADRELRCATAPPVRSASPAARRRARELGIDLSTVRGTGPGGRITEADVEDAAYRG